MAEQTKYQKRKVWMNTAAYTEKANIALEEETVRKTQAIYKQAAKDIQRQVDGLYAEIGKLGEANHWDFNTKKLATKKTVAELSKAIDKAGLTDLVPEPLRNRMGVVQAKELNIWLRIHQAGQDSHTLTKNALMKTMQNSGKAWQSAVSAGADSFVGFDRNICGYMMGMNWEGGNFSSRLWNAGDETWYKVKEELTRAMANGQQPATTQKHLENILRTAHQPNKTDSGGLAYAVERIIRTETAKASTEADLARWREMGVEKVQWSAVFEKNTCEHCRERDGRIYELKKVMLDQPPIHPNCRCTFIPYDDTTKNDDDTTLYKDSDGEYQEVQWAPYNSVIDEAGQLRSTALPVDSYFWRLSPWTTYRPPKAQFSYQGEIERPVVDLVERTAKTISDQFPEFANRMAQQFQDEITLHRGGSLIEGAHLANVGGLVDYDGRQVTITYPTNPSGGRTLKQMQDLATANYKRHFWSSPKENHTIVHEFGHVLSRELKARGISEEDIIRRATGKRGLKQALEVLKADISEYAGKNAGEGFAELFARGMSQDPKLMNQTTARFMNELKTALDQPVKRTRISVQSPSGAISAKAPLYTTEQSWKNALSFDERRALRTYSEMGYEEINSKLRKGYDPAKATGLKSTTEKVIDRVDTSLAKYTNAEKMTVWRGINNTDSWRASGKTIGGLKLGDTFTEKAYSSTSINKTAQFALGDKAVLFEIKVPAGTGLGAPITNISSYSNEAEFLIKRNATFKVTKIAKNQTVGSRTGLTIMTLELKP